MLNMRLDSLNIDGVYHLDLGNVEGRMLGLLLRISM